MYKSILILCLLITSEALFAMKYNNKDSSLYSKIDSNYIESCHNLLNAKLLLAGRFNKFSVTDNVTGKSLEYGINGNTNFGLGIIYKGIGIEFQFAPRGLNNDNALYGKSQQFSLSTSANSRRFIYDFYLRLNQGFHTTVGSPIPGDTTGALAYYYRPDIVNTNVGMEFVYLVNNKHFSSAAPYNLTQRQKKGAGSMLLGTFFSLYTIGADSVIFPDSLKEHFKPEVQFKDAGSLTFGLSYGYTYTFIFHKYWFCNLYTLPGLSVQQYFSTNAFNGAQTKSNVAFGFAFQWRIAFGYNRTKYYFGFSAMQNSYTINNDKRSSLKYNYGTVRLYYGYRFNLHKEYLKRF